MTAILEALSLLTPFDIDKKKIRLGPQADGGYVFVDDMTPEQAVVSYGISTEYGLDRDFADRGHEVFMFDHTIPEIDTRHSRMHFFREGVAGHSNEANSLHSIADHLSRHNIRGDRLILKMDVEGAEFDALIHTPDDIIGRFEQLVLELHSLDRLGEPEYRAQFCEILKKLNRHHTLFHVHANNFDGPDTFVFVGGLPVTRHIELSYVRSTSVTPRRSQTLYPTFLDFPNNAQRDKLLWIFPFLPNSTDPETFTLCARHVWSS
jgi:hypothetical protein